MYYNTCPYCGANLDPNERCDCQLEGSGEVKETRVDVDFDFIEKED